VRRVVSAESGAAGSSAVRGQVARRGLLQNVFTAGIWLAGSAVAVAAQPGTDRKLAALGAAVAGIATLLAVARLTPDRERRYVRSLVGAMVAVSVVGDLIIQQLVGGTNGFQLYGQDTRIALPLIFVLLAPLVLQALPVRLRSPALWRDGVWREARALDWLVASYALLILPDLALGIVHHAPKTYIAQDLGLIVFFVFAYVAGRAVSAAAGRASAIEVVVVLVALGAAQAIFGWATTPIFTYVEATCAAAVGFAVLQPSKLRLLLLVAAVALLANDAVAIKNGTGSTTAIELAAALGIVAYLLVRMRHLLPQWLVVGIAAAALVGFLAFTADGATVRGQYRGMDQSNLGRAYEAHQVRAATHSPVSFVFGRGLGASIDETQAPKLFAESLTYGGRDLAHVQEVHLLPYEFLLKYGLLGFAWLAAFVAGVAILAIRAFEAATRNHDPTPVLYAALPLLGVVAALGAATHLQDNPLNALGVGVLVTRFDAGALRWKAPAWLRLGVAVPATAVICAVLGAVAFAESPGRFVFSSYGAGGQVVPNAAAFVGDVRFLYPRNYHLRSFSSSSYAVTRVHGPARVHGVVVASYPLKRSPEVGGSGEVLRPDGVFFELYQAPRHAPALGLKKNLPLILYDFPGIPPFRNTPAIEQGGAFFRAHGHNYQAILWVGKNVPKPALLTVDNIIVSIGLTPPP
jgi:hypothetical protein